MRARFFVGFLQRLLLAIAILSAPLTAPAFARGAPDSFADLADKLLPTVVSIATSQTLKQPGPQASMPNIPPGSPLADLFKDFLAPQKSAPRHVTSLGTGFIIDPSGLIVTNNHVIEDAEHITATLNDGSVLPAKLIGRDEKTDLALLKVAPKKPLPAAKFGDSDHARVGDWVIAIGIRSVSVVPSPPVSSPRATATSTRGLMTSSSRPTRRSIAATPADRCSIWMAMSSA